MAQRLHAGGDAVLSGIVGKRLTYTALTAAPTAV